MQTTIVDWVKKHTENSPHKVAVVDQASGRKISYKMLDDRISKLASLLRSMGVKKGDRVGALSLASSDVAELEFATWRLGAIFVPINYRLSVNETLYILESASPKIVLYHTNFKAAQQTLSEKLSTTLWIETDGMGDHSEYENSLTNAEPLAESVQVSEDDACQILYSSGTTGKPKGIVVTHANMMFGMMNVVLAGYARPDTVGLCFMPLFHISGINGLVEQPRRTHCASVRYDRNRNGNQLPGSCRCD
jgi:fatty-acyl-CoA synthase